MLDSLGGDRTVEQGLATGVAAGTTSIVLRAERPEGWCGSEFESDTASLEVTD